MIQVCSRCGTRWNVRDRQRVWCPRCQGSLLAPAAENAPTAQWAAESARGAKPGAQPDARQRLPSGYRWIAVRPGAAPPPRRTRRPLGPTPRYTVIPRWGLQDRFDAPVAPPTVERSGPSARLVRGILVVALVALGIAVVAHLVRYVLLLINRSTLLNPIVAGVATWGGVLASVLVFFTLIAALVVLTNWLVARRAAAYEAQGVLDPRPAWELWLGCLVPFLNLFWAPVFVLELASVEGRLTWLRGTIVTWWCVWWVSFALSVFSIATSFTTDVQGIANNTVATIVAYLGVLAALLLTMRVYGGFEEHATVDRPVRRWVVVGDESPDSADSGGSGSDAEPGAPVEAGPAEPAALAHGRG